VGLLVLVGPGWQDRGRELELELELELEMELEMELGRVEVFTQARGDLSWDPLKLIRVAGLLV
jgi:hypothetical protein